MTSFSFIPANLVSTVLGGFYDVVADNYPVVLALLGVMLGIRFILGRVKAATKGKA
jgi:F0F1-type ATP synthase assembly protein I